jgi:tetratricopeptide (TPR) repeat protein
LAIALLVACPARGPAVSAEASGPDADAIRWQARHALENGRALRAEGRTDAAERVLRRALVHDPENVKLLRELANVLDAEGRAEEARAARARADAIDPPASPLPMESAGAGRGASLVVLVESTTERRLEEPGTWPEERVIRALEERIAVRLPGAALVLADPESVSGAARWLVDQQGVRALSLRVDRADCRFSVKDGAIAVVELRAAAAARGEPVPGATRMKIVVEDPDPDDCLGEAVGRAFEAALQTEAWQKAARRGARKRGSDWTTTRLRPLFPGLTRRIERELLRGQALLRAGQLSGARSAFREAARIDPEDERVLEHLTDAERSLALAREIAARAPGDPGDPGVLDPRLSPEQRAAAQVALEREQRRRDELLAALAVLDEDVRPPAATALDTLRPVEIRLPGAFGPTLARRRAGGPVEARAAYAPDGSVLARYYFAESALEPLVREEDTSGDGSADRWIAYRDAARSEIFEDAGASGRPDRRLVFADGGEPLERIELDLSGNGRPDRVFRYDDGALLAVESDTNGDGTLDRFDRFGADGRVDMREEDLDGDGSIDVRSVFRGGKLVGRTLSDPAHLPES